MTLYRQIIIFTLVLFLLLFTGTWLAKLESTRTFLMTQLESHAQDTATSLGVSLSQHLANDDMPAVETLINAVFDRGYYMIIRLADTDGKTVAEHKLDVAIENVPQWFIRHVSIDTPEATANVMKGWFQMGTIYVKSHPGYAYKTLWETTTRMSIWFMVTGILVVVAASLGLRLLLQPLLRVEKQADALCNKQYDVQKNLPRTRELRRVVEAMNRMTVKVREMFDEQVGVAERLREYAYRDPLTGLGNRRYFESQIKAHLESGETKKKGIVVLVQICDLEQLNQHQGYQAGDELLKRVAKELRETTVGAFSCAVARRLSGGGFGIYLPDAAPMDAHPIAETIINRLSRLAAERMTLTDNVAHVGSASFDIPVTFERLMSAADLALRAAQQAGPNSWRLESITDRSEEMPLGEQKWKAAIEQALEKKEIAFYTQPTVRKAGQKQALHLEIFSRIVREDGKLIHAGVFMPFAERLRLVSTLDRIVIEKVSCLDRKNLGIDTVAVNVSPTSLRDTLFTEWTRSLLSHLPKTAPRIIFEFSEFSAVQHLELVRKFSDMAREFGHGIGLDHYGQSFSNLGYLKSLRPEYVKIDRGYTSELRDDESDGIFFISSLCSVAHSIDVSVIVEGVENETQLRMLGNLNVDAMQGYFIERPKAMALETPKA
jgi:diguanylate cyclase (GGDEF)-like protein